MAPPVHTPVVVQGDPGFVPVKHDRGPLSTLPDWWALLAGGPGSSSGYDTPFRDPITTPVAIDALLPVPFGQVRVGGLMLYVQGLGGDSLTYGRGVIAWCEGEIGSIDAVWGNTGPFGARSDSIVTTALTQHVGEPGGDTNPWDVSYGNIFSKPQPGLANVAYTYWTISTVIYWYRWWRYLPGGIDSGPSSGGMDTVPWAADIHALKLYDPRLDSTNGGTGTQRYADPTTWTYSNNPILICRYILVKYGHLVNGVDIDDPNIAAMAQACDDAGFTCNVVFTTKTLVSVALGVVLQTCNGKPITVNGRAGFYLDIPNPGAAVASFSEEDGDIFGLKYEWLSARDRYTQVAVSFNNKDANYKLDQTPFFGDPATFSSEPTTIVSSVNTTTDTLTMASSPGWSVNDTVLFFQNAGGTIPGLSDGATYVVKTISGADVTLASSAGGTAINLTGTPTITTQYLQRVGVAYPPTVPVKPLVVNAPGINTLAAAIILRDYSYKASAITFRISGTMNGRGILLQEGQKIHVKTLKGVDADFLLLQIPGDAQGFFTFAVKPYSAGTYSSTPISQPPPIVTPARPNDINVTDRTQTKQVLTSTDSTHDNYDVFQLVEYVLPVGYAGTIDHLAVRGSEADGAQSQQWPDLAASEISVATAGNATATDGTHENLYHTAVRRATRVITYSTRPTVLTDVTTEHTTRIIVKSVSADGSASNGVTTDYTAGVGASAPPTTAPLAGLTSPLVIPPSGTSTGLGGELQMRELVAGGTNSTGFGAPDALAGDLRYVLPATGPSVDGQALVFDGVTGGYAGRKITKWDLPYVEKLMIETPSGALDGVNRSFVLSQLPMTAKILLFGDNMQPFKGGYDYGRSGQAITLAFGANRPVSTLVAVYSYRAQVGSIVGSSETISGAWTLLGSLGLVGAIVRVGLNLYVGGGETSAPAFKSTDAGATWGPMTIATLSFQCLVVDPAMPSTLYVASFGYGVYKTTDSGTTWVQNTVLSGKQCSAIVVHPTTGTIYVGTESNGLYKSTDAGATWTAVTTGDSLIRCLVVDPVTPSTMYASAFHNGVIRSTDSGATWSARSSAPIQIQTLVIDPSNTSVMYAATMSNGVYKSTDAGVTWAASNSGLTNLDTFALRIRPSVPSTLYLTTNGGGVFKSTDSGATWAAINSGLTELHVYSVEIDDSTIPPVIYVATASGIFGGLL